MKKLYISAFTLVELLVVISIIGILVGLSVFGLQGARKASRDAVRKADLETIRSGLGIYKADCDTYPTTASFSLPSAQTLIGSGNPTACSASNTYITQVPTDPVPGSNYTYNSDGVTYHVCAALEQVPSSLPDTTQCGGNCGTGCNYVVTNP